MEITASQVMELREKTGVSMMACKKALVEAEGDMTKAIDILRKKGEAKAAEKAERTTHEGSIFFKSAGDKTAAVGIACETDFVARSDDFSTLGNKLAELALAEGEEKAMSASEALVKEVFLKLGENMNVAFIKVFTGKVVGSYLHSNFKVGGIAVLEGGTEEQAKDVAMHLTATNPKYLSPDNVDADFIAKEKEIMKEQLKNEGKPENLWDKILEGKVKKLREENSLLTQPFVKDPTQKVQDYLGSGKVVSYERFSI